MTSGQREERKNRMKNTYRKLLNFITIVGFVGVLLLLAASTIATIIYNEPYVMAGICIGVLYVCFANSMTFVDKKEEAHQMAVKYYNAWIRHTKQI